MLAKVGIFSWAGTLVKMINVRDFFKPKSHIGSVTFGSHLISLKTFFPLFSDVHDSMARFRAVGVWNYTMLTLAEHERVLYVGAREHIFALDPNDISRQLRPQVCSAK